MKRIATIILLTVCFLALGSWSYAGCKGCKHGCEKGVSASDTCNGKNYVDEDGDGICDNADSCKCEGQCKGCKCAGNKAAGNDSQHGAQYVDEDGDGKCDHLEKKQGATE